MVPSGDSTEHVEQAATAVSNSAPPVTGNASVSACPLYRVVEAMVAEGFTIDHLAELPVGIAMPLYEVLRACQRQAHEDWPPTAHALVRRADLARWAIMVKASTSAGRPERHSVLGSSDNEAPAAFDAEAEDAVPSDSGSGSSEPWQRTVGSVGRFTSSVGHELTDPLDTDGTLAVVHGASALIASDRRIYEVRKLLRSNKKLLVRVPNNPDASSQSQDVQLKLALQVRRCFGIPIGRGLFTLGSLSPSATTVIPMPEITVKGKIAPRNTPCELDLAAAGMPELPPWVMFHNGVAAGLRVCADYAGDGEAVTRSWIQHNRAAHSMSEHGGFLLALGLHRHLHSLVKADIYSYLHMRNEVTTAGLLLGLAVSKRGSMNEVCLACEFSWSDIRFIHCFFFSSLFRLWLRCWRYTCQRYCRMRWSVPMPCKLQLY